MEQDTSMGPDVMSDAPLVWAVVVNVALTAGFCRALRLCSVLPTLSFQP